MTHETTMETHPTLKREIDKLWPLFEAVYSAEAHGCGGCCHIVSDDNNVEDTHLDYCKDYAEAEGCRPCLAFLEALRVYPPLSRYAATMLLHERL